MGYRGMVVIDNEDYGESMEILHGIKKSICKLVEKLSEAEMYEDNYRGKDEFEVDDDDDRRPRNTHHAGRRMPSRYNY